MNLYNMSLNISMIFSFIEMHIMFEQLSSASACLRSRFTLSDELLMLSIFSVAGSSVSSGLKTLCCYNNLSVNWRVQRFGKFAHCDTP